MTIAISTTISMSISQGVCTVSKSVAIPTIGSIEGIRLWLSLSITFSIPIPAIAKTISMAIAKRRVAKIAITMSQRISAVSKTISSIRTIESIGLRFSITLSITISTIAKTKSTAVAKMAITMSQRISTVSKTILSIRTIESISLSFWFSLGFTLSVPILAIAKTISMAIAKRRVTEMAIAMSYRISSVSKTISSIRTIKSISFWFSLGLTFSIPIPAIAKTISMAIAKRRVAEMPCTIPKMMTSIAIQRVSISSSQSCSASQEGCPDHGHVVWRMIR